MRNFKHLGMMLGFSMLSIFSLESAASFPREEKEEKIKPNVTIPPLELTELSKRDQENIPNPSRLDNSRGWYRKMGKSNQVGTPRIPHPKKRPDSCGFSRKSSEQLGQEAFPKNKSADMIKRGFSPHKTTLTPLGKRTVFKPKPIPSHSMQEVRKEFKKGKMPNTETRIIIP